MPAAKPTYSQEQIHRIYDRISLPIKYRYDPGEQTKKIARRDGGLELLSALQRHMLANVPFENLALHYSRHRIVDIDADALFDKIVTQDTGRGGYCMENNTLFATLLRSLGFDVMSTGGRVKSSASSDGAEPPYGSFGHMVNIVTIQSVRYLVDVGFGGSNLTHPLPLVDGNVSMNIAPNQSVRLIWSSIPDNENSEAKVWVYQRRNADDKPWDDMYCFPDNLEFLQADFEMMNHWTSTRSTVFFTHKVVCVKFLLSDDGKEIVGNVVLYEEDAKRYIHGEKEVITTCKTEAERVHVLKEYFGITLSDEQKAGIRGMVTALA